LTAAKTAVRKAHWMNHSPQLEQDLKEKPQTVKITEHTARAWLCSGGG
jgi:hypothetical protein